MDLVLPPSHQKSNIECDAEIIQQFMVVQDQCFKQLLAQNSELMKHLAKVISIVLNEATTLLH